MFINCSKYNETDGDCKEFYGILAVLLQGGLQYTREFHPMIHLARSPNIRYMNQVNAHEIMKIKSAIMGTCKGIGKSNFPIKIKIGPTTK